MGRTKSAPRRSNLRNGNFTSGGGSAAFFPAFNSGTRFCQSAFTTRPEPRRHCDLVSLFALTQKFGIDILPLTWLPHLEGLGLGGTAEIKQALINTQMDLAFKRLHLDDSLAVSTSAAYRILIAEICALGQSPMRDHPNVLKLQGICFDATEHDAMIRPVLVFEKAKFGDLESFMRSEKGLLTTTDQRLNMLGQLASAVSLLHSAHVIHGDIKPANVLISERDGGLVPLISDFGYSTISDYGDDSASILLSQSKHWSAPEHTFEPVRFTDARKMDVYSMGLLCLWLLFYEQVSGSAKLPFMATDDGIYQYFPWNWNASIDDWIEGGRINRLVSLLMKAHQIKSERLPEKVEYFLLRMLDPCPETRLPCLDQLEAVLGSREYGVTEFAKSALLHGNQSRFDLDAQEIQGLLRPGAHLDFHIKDILHSLTDMDHRVRKHLFHNLVNLLESECASCQQNAAYQLAVCYAIGFSTKPDHRMTAELLEKSCYTQEQLDQEIFFISHAQDTRAHNNKDFSTLWNMGHLLPSDPSVQYRQQRTVLLAEVEERLLEISQASVGLAPNHSYVFGLRSSLVGLYVALGNLNLAKDLCEDLMDEMMGDTRHGSASVLPWVMMTALAGIHHLDSEYTRAAELLELAVERLTELAGEDNVFTLMSMADLSRTYEEQARNEEAMGLLSEVVDRINRVLGSDHPSTVRVQNDLGILLYRQADFEEAERIFRRVLARKRQLFGLGNWSTLVTLGNLAMALRYGGKLDEAEVTARQTLQLRREILPNDFSNLIASTGNLATILSARGKLTEAEDLGTECLELSKSKLGPNHIETFRHMHNLASILQVQGRHQESLALYTRSLHGKEDHDELGMDHPFTLDTVSNMAMLHEETEDYAEAERYHQRVLLSYERRAEESSASYLTALHHLAAIAHHRGNCVDAEKYALQAYQATTRVSSPEDPSALAILQTYALICLSLGRVETARQLCHRVLDLREKSLEAQDALVLESCGVLAVVYCILARYDLAKHYSQRTLSRGEKELFPVHPLEPMRSASDLSRIVIKQAREAETDGPTSLEEARQLAEEAMARVQAIAIPTHPLAAKLLWRLGAVIHSRGMPEIASRLLGQACQILAERLGTGHVDYQECSRHLDDCLSRVKPQ